jgi:hypothetical protein
MYYYGKIGWENFCLLQFAYFSQDKLGTQRIVAGHTTNANIVVLLAFVTPLPVNI